jgi:serine/threonine protein kinase
MVLAHSGADDRGLVGRVIAGDLKVTERTGLTPQGALYAAEDPEGRRVVLLVLPRVAGQDARSLRFATRIRHPNVAAVYAVGDLEDGSTYVVLEELSGEPLPRLLSASPVLPMREALNLTLQIAEGLEALHRGAVVHGNVSPSVVVVTRQRFGKPQVKLVGFNLYSDAQRATRLEPGNIAYASPERLSGSPPDPRDDVYSLAALLHRLLSGSPPSPGEPVDQVPELARPVLDKALGPLPVRYRTMSDFRKALEAMAAAAVTSPAYRRILGRAVAAGLVVVASAVLLAPLWRRVGTGRSEPAAMLPPPPPAQGAPLATSANSEAIPPAAEVRRRPARRSNERPRDTKPDPGPSPDAAGYVGEARSSDVWAETAQSEPPLPVREGSAATATQSPPPPSRRPRAILDRDPGLRLALGDVLRVGVAEGVIEARLGLLVVYLAPDGMRVPSAEYNLQRLYLAYSAATEPRDTLALELRRNGELYGWFTRDGLRYASQDPDRH